ncbi:MAG: DUF4388 domain-containing protein [Thermoanaerobaculia bacterium]
MALEGSLKDFGIQDIFQLIGLQRKTGVLTIKSPYDTIYITFLDGKIVNADSEKSRVESKLGKVLIKRGSISEEQLNKALQIQQQTLQRLGYILVRNGFIDHEELKNALTQQIMQIVHKVFRWREGEYYFSQEIAVEYDRDSIIPITSESVLMEGAQMLDEWPMIEKVVKSPDIVFEKINPSFEVISDDSEDFDVEEGKVEKKEGKIVLTKVAYDVYNLIDGISPVSDIIDKARYTEFYVAKALYELYQKGLIQEKKEEPVKEGEKIEEVKIEEEEKPQQFALLPIVAILVLFTLFNLFRFKNPLNSFSSLVSKKNIFNEIKYQKSFLNINLLDNSIRTYFLSEGNYPSSLQDLFKYNLADLNILLDPWGRGYLYLIKDKNYYLIGFNHDGTQSLELIYTYIMSGGMEKEYQESEKKKKRNLVFVD